MTYAELGGMDALLVDRLYLAHVVRRELDVAREDERAQRCAMIANGNIEHLDRELRKLAQESALRREQIAAMGESDPFEDEAESEFIDTVWWKADSGAA
jgi:hypothetical protein